MAKLININMGEMAVGHNDIHIKTGSIGSCVVVVLYDDKNKVGGMAHAMLPTKKQKAQDQDVIEQARSNIGTKEALAKYADESVDNLIFEIRKERGEFKNLKAKLIGGARMFKILSGDNFGIGYENIEAAKRRLGELGIPIESEEVGGTVGRIAELDLRNGLVDVSTKM